MGYLWAEYKNGHGGHIAIGEGDFCNFQGDPSTCWDSTGAMGSALFGDLTGSLNSRAAVPTWTAGNYHSVSATGPVYAIYVNGNGTKTHGYEIVGQGMTQTAFVAIAAAMVVVPKA
jgi:hypothetical protein